MPISRLCASVSSTRRSRIIGYDALYLLGYRDSGMPDTEPNAHPDNFANADLDEAVGRLVEIVRAERPQVIVGYARDRVYAHPDHVRVHEITVLAFERAGDPEWYPDARRTVAADEAVLQQRVHPRAHPALHDWFVEQGEESPFAKWVEHIEADAVRAAGDDDDDAGRTTTRIDVRD